MTASRSLMNTLKVLALERRHMMIGKIFDIQRFSVFDGPGARTVIFLKGCNLKCKWCHNPESIDLRSQIQVNMEYCIGCERCIEICENNRISISLPEKIIKDYENCTNCLKCTDSCFANARTVVGKDMSPETLIEEIMTDYEYYISTEGGVTFSGGECMLQIEFIEEMLKRCKQEGIHTAIDTAGNVPWNYFDRINPYTDLYLYDIKAIDSNRHMELTGVNNKRIIRNYRNLIAEGKRVIVRVPYIDGANDMEMEKIGELLGEVQPEKVEVLPYHSFGESKRLSLQLEGESEGYKEPTEEQLDRVMECFIGKGLKVRR